MCQRALEVEKMMVNTWTAHRTAAVSFQNVPLLPPPTFALPLALSLSFIPSSPTSDPSHAVRGPFFRVRDRTNSVAGAVARGVCRESRHAHTMGVCRRLPALMLLTHSAAGLLVRVAGPCTREAERIHVASSPSQRPGHGRAASPASLRRSLAGGGALRMRGGGDDRRNADGDTARSRMPWGVVF